MLDGRWVFTAAERCVACGENAAGGDLIKRAAVSHAEKQTTALVVLVTAYQAGAVPEVPRQGRGEHAARG